MVFSYQNRGHVWVPGKNIMYILILDCADWVFRIRWVPNTFGSPGEPRSPGAMWLRSRGIDGPMLEPWAVGNKRSLSLIAWGRV